MLDASTLASIRLTIHSERGLDPGFHPGVDLYRGKGSKASPSLLDLLTAFRRLVIWWLSRRFALGFGQECPRWGSSRARTEGQVRDDADVVGEPPVGVVLVDERKRLGGHVGADRDLIDHPAPVEPERRRRDQYALW